jgi:hypothetical protein
MFFTFPDNSQGYSIPYTQPPADLLVLTLTTSHFICEAERALFAFMATVTEPSEAVQAEPCS